MFKNILTISIRNFTKRKVYSIVNVTGLAIAIATCLIVYSFVKSELTYDQFNINHEDIYRLNVKFKRGEIWREGGAVAPVMAPELANNTNEIESFARIKTAVSLLKVNGEYREELFHYADPNLFDIFSFPLVFGELNSFENDPNTAIVTEEYALTNFNTKEVIGELVEVNLQDEFQVFEIKAVVKDIPNNSSVRFDLLLPFSKFEQVAGGDWMTSWRAWGVTTFMLLNPEVEKMAFEARISEQARNHFPEDQQSSIALSIQPLKDIYFNQNVRGISKTGSITTSWILMAIAAFILIIASINFTNLMISMAMPRLKEVALRKIVGASKVSLILQFLGEALFNTLIAFIIAVLMADLMLPIFNDLTNTSVVFLGNIGLDFILFSTVLIFFIALLAGGYPAYVIAKFNPIESFKDSKAAAKSYVFRYLVIIQFTLAIFFSLSIGTIFQQLEFMYSADKGYNDEHIMTVYVRDLDGNLILDRMSKELAVSTHISSVAAYGWTSSRVNVDNESYRIQQTRVHTDFFRTMGIEPIAGRLFHKNGDNDIYNSIVVNRAFITELNISMDDAIGTEIPLNGFEGMQNPVIIGVLDNVKFESLENEVAPRVFHLHSDQIFKRIIIKYESGKENLAYNELQEVWNTIFEVRPLEVEYLSEINKNVYAGIESQKQVVTYTGIISILISCLGLFALSSLKIQQRSKEVGIRRILGASFGGLVVTLSSNISWLLGLSILLALPLAWYASTSWLKNFAYQVELSYLPFLGILLTVLVLAVFSISYQLFKTANTNPADTLRTE